MGKSWENHRMIGKSKENHGKIIGESYNDRKFIRKSWENDRKIMGSERKTHGQLMGKSSETHRNFMRKSWENASHLLEFWKTLLKRIQFWTRGSEDFPRTHWLGGQGGLQWRDLPGSAEATHPHSS